MEQENWPNYGIDIAGNNYAGKLFKQNRKRKPSGQMLNYIFTEGENNSGKLIRIQVLEMSNNTEKVCMQVQYAPESTDYNDEIYQSVENIIRKISTKISSNAFND